MLNIKIVTVTPFMQNCRIVSTDSSAECVVIDPGGDVPLILRELSQANLKCTQIWLTHAHVDHCGGVSKLKLETGAKLFAHPIEKFLRENVKQVCLMYGLPVNLFENCPEPDTYIEGGETLSIANEQFQVLFTPGHAPGHVCFYSAKHSQLIAGDTLFAGSIGRTDLPGADHKTLMRSIKQVIATLPDDTRILPGHGPDTILSHEKKTNPFLLGDL